VALDYAIRRPEDLASITLVNPMSPYGFGGTKDIAGTPCHEDFAGSGGGTANPEFVSRLALNDRGDEDQNSPRNVMNQFYFSPPFKAPEEREEVYLSSVLSTQTGEDNYPGDMTTSENWPGVAPGERGVNNAISPKYCDVSGFTNSFAGIELKPPVLWVRGAEDRIVSDASLLDLGTLGAMGAVPGWPGEETFPSQPMVSQMRAVLEEYVQGGGSYREEVVEGCGHTPHVEEPEEFRRLVFGFLGETR
jgi:pimeloyl-ACP methyl ester carboxylesterase